MSEDLYWHGLITSELPPYQPLGSTPQNIDTGGAQPTLEDQFWAVNLRQQRINNLSTSMKVIEEYLKVKVTDRDWHAVGDAANELREIEAEIGGLQL